MRIYKYTLDMCERQSIKLQGRILSVACQGDSVVLYALYDEQKDARTAEIQLVGTGHLLPVDDWRFIGTAIMADGTLMWHVFVNPATEHTEATTKRRSFASDFAHGLANTKPE